MKKTEQNSSNKQLKKWKILTGVFAGLTAVGIATSITLPLVLNKENSTPTPTEDEIWTGSYEATYEEKTAPVAPASYPQAVAEDTIPGYQFINKWLEAGNNNPETLGNMLAYELVTGGSAYGEPSNYYKVDIVFNFTQMTIVSAHWIYGTGEDKAEIQITNMPFSFEPFVQQGSFGGLWHPLGSIDDGFNQCWNFPDISCSITIWDSDEEKFVTTTITSDSTTNEISKVWDGAIMYLLGTSPVLKNLKLK